jgi:diguanylate cyclase (GGDEF)-like protein
MVAEMRHAIRQILNGTRPIDDKMKYTIMGLELAMIHCFFAIAFKLLHITPLFWYNTAVVVYYCYVSWALVKKEKFVTVSISTFVEILFHSALASLLLGWNWGFMIYTVALVPVAFYLTYTLSVFKEKVMPPVICSLIVMICFMTIRVMTVHITPCYTVENESIITYSYCFNSMIAFVMLLLFSTLFSLEIRYMQRQLKQENKTLVQIANFDPLTHLANRRSMNAQLKLAMEEAVSGKSSFCLVMADIDDFKKVNDTYGHECGDEILIIVSEIVSNNVREQDYVCRWGGEEMLILLKTDKETAVSVAERICKEVSENAVEYKEENVGVTLTLGVSQYQNGENIRTIIDRADKNLYYGKNHGKNQVVFDKDSLEKA